MGEGSDSGEEGGGVEISGEGSCCSWEGESSKGRVRGGGEGRNGEKEGVGEGSESIGIEWKDRSEMRGRKRSVGNVNDGNEGEGKHRWEEKYREDNECERKDGDVGKKRVLGKGSDRANGVKEGRGENEEMGIRLSMKEDKRKGMRVVKQEEKRETGAREGALNQEMKSTVIVRVTVACLV